MGRGTSLNADFTSLLERRAGIPGYRLSQYNIPLRRLGIDGANKKGCQRESVLERIPNP